MNRTPHYTTTHWPAGTTEAQKAECRALAKGGCELNVSEEALAQAMAMIGPRSVACMGFERSSDGFIHMGEAA